jgi:hypothetical protein
MSNGSLPARSPPISNQKRSYRCIDVCVMVQNNKNAVIACMPSCDTSVTRAIARTGYAGQLDHLNDVKVCLVACVPMSASGSFFKTKSKKKNRGSCPPQICRRNAPSMSSLAHPVAFSPINVAKAIAPANKTNPFLQKNWTK